MTKNEYLNKYINLIQMISEKEAKTEVYINRWLNGESLLSLDAIENTINLVNEQIKKMKEEAQICLLEFERITKEEELKEEKLFSSNISKMILRQKFSVDTSSIAIIDGVLSSNKDESYLIGREKSEEEIQLEKQVALSILREKVLKKEITLREASEIKNDIENAYNLNNKQSKK